ncbi:PAS domain-containing protein [Congregibacter litoralis]|uniref:PAS domain-containing protein n=1 Tax=Congregibacter litoralis TaxID=393662 RepID=UPI0006884B59|nr:PAS domain-containing protein [Congregibacter litoralis]
MPAPQLSTSGDYVTSHVCEDLYRQTPVSSAVILFVVAIFWLALKDQSDLAALNIWAATLTGSVAVRYSIWYQRRRSPQRFGDQGWMRLFSASSVMVGASWSLMFLSVSDWSNLAALAAPWMLMLGVLSAASVALGPHIPTFILYSAPPVFISGCIMLFRSIDSLGWLLVAYWAYYLILLGLTRTTNRTYLARLALAAENQSLLDALQAQASGQEEVIATRTAELRKTNRDLAEQMSRREELERIALEDLALLGSVINATSDLIYYKDYARSDGCYLGCNNAYAEFLGRTPEDIVGKTDEDFFDTEEADIRRESEKSVLKDGSKVVERWIDHPSGSRRLLSARLMRLRRPGEGSRHGEHRPGHHRTQKSRRNSPVPTALPGTPGPSRRPDGPTQSPLPHR